MLRSSGLIAAVCVSALLAAPVATALWPQEEWGDERAGKIPIPSRIGDLWVSAEMLISRNDSLLLAAYPMIDQRWSAELAAALEYPPEQCLEIGPGSYASYARLETFSEAVTTAAAIIHGTVVGIAGGFHAGMHPGLLIQVEVQEWVKRKSGYPETPYVYFYYPVGDFRLGSIRICKKTPGWPDPPEVGDEVLLSPQVTPMDPEGIMAIVTTDGEEMVIGNPAGIRISSALSEIEEFRTATSIQALKRLIEEMLQEQ